MVYLCASVITLWTSARARIIWIAGLLAGYYAITRFVSVPGCDHAAWFTQHCTWPDIDHKLMVGHLYTVSFDPEGLLSTFPAIATTLMATLGRIISERSYNPLASSSRPGPCRGGRSGCRLRGASLVPDWQTVVGDPIRALHRWCWMSYLALCCWLIEIRGWRMWAKPFLGWVRTRSWSDAGPIFVQQTWRHD